MNVGVLALHTVEAGVMTFRRPASLGPMLAAFVAACFLVAACSSDSSSGGGGSGSGIGAGASGSDPFGNPSASGSGGGSGSFGNPPNPTAGSGGAAAGGDNSGKTCADALVNAAKSEPVITLVIDGSGSMCETFGGGTRWSELRSALMDPTAGLVYQLQGGVDFGLLLYDGGIDLLVVLTALAGTPNPACAGAYAATRTGDCLTMRVAVPAALNNAAAIDAAYPQTELGGSTPTNLAMREAMDMIIASQPPPGPDTMRKPQYVVLATDGQPNSLCTGGLGGDPMVQMNEVIAEVDRGLQAGIKTFVISLAQDPVLVAHLEQVAAAGGTGTMPFTPMSKDELVANLTAIIGGAIGCQIFLNGTVTQGSECLGFVEMNGFSIPCNDPNGWRLVNPSTVELVGQACTDFLNSPGAMVRAGFPCGVFTPT